MANASNSHRGCHPAASGDRRTRRRTRVLPNAHHLR